MDTKGPGYLYKIYMFRVGQPLLLIRYCQIWDNFDHQNLGKKS